MQPENQALLENLLDALDRLFDRKMMVVDLHALVFATANALEGTDYFSILEPLAVKLLEISRMNCTADIQVSDALDATDALRRCLCDALTH